MKLLDTNIVSLILKGDPRVCAVLVKQPMHELCISSVTEGELAFGLAKRGHPAVLTRRVQEFLLRVDALPWDRPAAQAYGELRARTQAAGTTLSPLDLMIAAHAQALGATLVTADRAFARAGVSVEDWTA